MAPSVARPINDVIADNLQHYMRERGLNQSQLASASGVGQTTISLYLTPARRLPSKSGKSPSAKVTELAQLAIALQIDVWQLMRDMTPEERTFYSSIEAAYYQLRSSKP